MLLHIVLFQWYEQTHLHLPQDYTIYFILELRIQQRQPVPATCTTKTYAIQLIRLYFLLPTGYLQCFLPPWKCGPETQRRLVFGGRIIVFLRLLEHKLFTAAADLDSYQFLFRPFSQSL